MTADYGQKFNILFNVIGEEKAALREIGMNADERILGMVETSNIVPDTTRKVPIERIPSFTI